MESAQRQYWWDQVDLGSSRKKLPKNIAKIIAKWSLEHDQIKKTDCGKKGEDAMKNWELLMDLIDISKCEDKDQRQALDRMIKNHVYNCGLQYSNNGAYEEREIFILDDDDEVNHDTSAKEELERGTVRVWAPWTRRWFSSAWDGDTKPPKSVMKKEPPLYLTARSAIRKALPHLTEAHKQLLIELINEKPCMPSTSSKNEERLATFPQLKRQHGDIDTADKSRDSMETIEDGANEVGEEISNEQTFSIQNDQSSNDNENDENELLDMAHQPKRAKHNSFTQRATRSRGGRKV